MVPRFGFETGFETGCETKPWFLTEQKYTDYRNAIISIIGGDESKFSSHTAEVIEQKEV